MKKILIIPSWYPEIDNPNQGAFVKNQIELLSEKFDIRVMAGILINNSSRIKKLWISIKYFLNRSLSLIRSNKLFVSPPYVYGFEYFKGINILVDRNFQIKIASYVTFFESDVLPKWKPDLIHAHNSNFTGIVAAEISEKYSIPYVITDHHHINPSLTKYVQNKVIEAFLGSRANCFVSSWQYRTYLLANGNITGEIVGNPVDSYFYTLHPFNKEKKIISHLSGGFDYKDVDTLFNSITEFYKSLGDFSKIEVHIAGFSDGVISYCNEKFGQNSWFQTIKFVGPLKEDQVAILLQKSLVYLHTSTHESFGISCLEALLCGTPVVSTNNGGINEFLIDGINGLLCKIKDSKSIGIALADICKGNIIFDSKVVRSSVVNKFGDREFVKTMSKIYNRACK